MRPLVNNEIIEESDVMIYTQDVTKGFNETRRVRVLKIPSVFVGLRVVDDSEGVFQRPNVNCGV